MNKQAAKKIVCQIAANLVSVLDAEAFFGYSGADLERLEAARDELAAELLKRGGMMKKSRIKPPWFQAQNEAGETYVEWYNRTWKDLLSRHDTPLDLNAYEGQIDIWNLFYEMAEPDEVYYKIESAGLLEESQP